MTDMVYILSAIGIGSNVAALISLIVRSRCMYYETGRVVTLVFLAIGWMSSASALILALYKMVI